MDMTPPSLMASPQSSPRRLHGSSPCPSNDSCLAENAAASYPSPAQPEFHYKPSSPYRHHDHRAMSMTSQDSLAHSTWTTSDSMSSVSSAASSSSSLPNILSTEYDPFANYDSCLPGPYNTYESYPPGPPSSASSILSRTSSSTGVSARLPSMGYGHDHSANRIKVEAANGYSPSLMPAQYSAAPALPVSYGADASAFHAGAHHYATPEPTYGWPKSDYETTQLYSSPDMTSLSHAARRPNTIARRRPTRKHTTKEEANFQCEVKGCGKFFSRSYNYKSHMETHDEKREYPFPCPMDNCDKKFVRKTDLQRHHQSVHTKERNHKCDYCARPFARKDTLRRHMEDGCSRRFDLGTLDVRAESYGSPHSLHRQPASCASHISSTSSMLPPMTMASMTALPRDRVFPTAMPAPIHTQIWGR
ncbi:hypothetical protein B0I35DRAFT_411917 [Stachybotrys elegans]|uniref:C2H2-type domain-containing protein n=1 Tax=Stachybotrys elegans TaxID=80388 RepID=A0A8K0WND2_9HYPO|nr:hypothetical protein B0I35DRAFT_411917 [Stachybotrys elegans]